MPSLLNQQLTNVGWDALSKALGGGRLTFFKLQAGDGQILNDAEIPPMTALVHPITDIAINNYFFEGEGQVTLQGNLNSKDLDVGFTFRELAVFATIEEPVAGQGATPLGVTVIKSAPSTKANPSVPPPNTGTVVMYSYCNAYANSDYVPGKTETTDVVNTIQVVVKIDKAASFSIQIVAGEQMAVTNIGPPSVGAGPWSYTEANVAYLKRLVPGPEILIEENANTITIGKKQLKEWMNLWVAHGNPDVPPHFSTLQRAYAYLQQYSIPNYLGASIYISRGTWDIGDTIWLTHTDGNRIFIIGEDLPAYGFSSIGLSAGGQWNYWMNLNGIDSTNFLPWEGYALIYGVTGSNGWGSALLPGIYPVVGKGPGYVTIWIRSKVPYWPDMTGFYWGGVFPINTVFRVPKNKYGLWVGNNGLGWLRSVCIRAAEYPTWSSCGLTSIGYISLSKVGVYGFNPGMYGECCHAIYVANSGGQAYIDYCACTDNHSGFVCAGGASMNIWHGASSHNSLRGIWCEGGYVGGANTYLWLAGNQNEGIINSGGNVGFIRDYRQGPSNIFTMYNRTGMTTWCRGRSVVQDDGSAMHSIFNQDWDVETEILSMHASQSRVFGSRRFNHPIGLMSNYAGMNL
jgi:hypothetical protein